MSKRRRRRVLALGAVVVIAAGSWMVVSFSRETEVTWVEARIDDMLGHPTVCPHGAPIPAPDGTVATRSWIRLSGLEVGQTATVSRVSDHDAALLRHLGELGMVPQTVFTVIDVAPFEGPLTVCIGETEHVIGRQVANHIFVEQNHSEDEE